MKFTKMHGCGNDYVYINVFEEQLEQVDELARRVSERRTGIGSDGIITIGPSNIADFRMHIYNADGSEAEMCGNGIRCVAKYVYDHGLTDRMEFGIESNAGIKYVKLMVEQGKVQMVRVDMGEPRFEAAQIPVCTDKEQVVDERMEVCGKEWKVTCVSMGNPHAVTFVEDLEHFEITDVGPAFEHHPNFPQRTNTEFVKRISEKEVAMRVWERGSAETFACGTGACAATMACIVNGYTEEEVLVHLLGGDLLISYNRENNHVFMTGPATEVFSGEMDI